MEVFIVLTYYNGVYCDICGLQIKRGAEYFVHDQRDKSICSDSCLETYAIEYMEDEVLSCVNDDKENLI